MKPHPLVISILIAAGALSACQSTPPLDTSNPQAILTAANAGHQGAAALLGPSYFSGTNGFEKNMVEAARWLPAAVDQGDTTAMAQLGFLYLNGTGVTADPAKALELIGGSAKAGDTLGQYYLGLMNMQGVGLAANPTEGARLITLAAQAGNGEAMKSLGDAYRDGQGVGANPTEALNWYTRAGAAGNPAGLHAAGELQEQGKVGPKDPVRAAGLYKNAADLGHAKSMYRLSQMHQTGLGVQKNSGQALEWLMKAADAEDPDAMRDLAQRYAKGHGVPKDPAKAAALTDKLRASGVETASDTGKSARTTAGGDGNAPAERTRSASNSSGCSAYYPGRVLRTGGSRLQGSMEAIVLEVGNGQVTLGAPDGQVIGTMPCR